MSPTGLLRYERPSAAPEGVHDNLPDAIGAPLASLTLAGIDIGTFDASNPEDAGTLDEGVTATGVTALAMPIASGTPSPPGRSLTMRASWIVQHLLGHRSPNRVRRYSATYGSAQAAQRHAAFSRGDGMLAHPS